MILTEKNKEQLRHLATATIQEATALRTFATEKERGRLFLRTLAGENALGCIYGQMTGHCSSDRSLELLKLCAIPLAKDFDHWEIDGFDAIDWVELEVEEKKTYFAERLKSWKEEGQDEWQRLKSRRIFSAIEIYIMGPFPLDPLVNYLQGEEVKELTIETLMPGLN